MTSKNFDFEHKIFAIEGALFTRSPDKRAIFQLRLGELDVSLPVEIVREEFQIEEGTEDAHLLEMVVDGLKHVKVIRPGDSIPSEILDGSASWSIDDRHLDIARGRLAAQMMAWMGGKDKTGETAANLIALTDSPENKEQIDAAVAKLAEKLAYGADGTQQVQDMLERFARDLAYIEALREHAGRIRDIRRGLAKAHEVYRRDRNIAEEVQRMTVLMRKPLAWLDEAFLEVDDHTADLLTVLKQLDQFILLVRDTRDKIHAILLEWDEIFSTWANLPLFASPSLEQALRRLYQFLASTYPDERDWRDIG